MDENSQWTGNTLPKNSTHTTTTHPTPKSPDASKPSPCSDAAHRPDKFVGIEIDAHYYAIANKCLCVGFSTCPPPNLLKGVGFLRACLLAEPPNRVFLSPCERDARAPSTRNAGNAGVPPAIPTAREKTYPFKRPRGRLGGGHVEKPTQRHLPIALAEFAIAPLREVPPASRGEPSRAPTWFPLRAGGTLRRGASVISIRGRHTGLPLPCVRGYRSQYTGLVNAIGASPSSAVNRSPTMRTSTQPR